MPDKFGFGSSGGGSSSKFGFSVPPPPKSKSRSGQLVERELARKKKGRGFLGSLLHGGGVGLGWTLRQISRPAWAVAEGTRRAAEGEGFDIEDFFKGMSRGIQAKRHTTFSDVIRQEAPGFAKRHKVWTAVGGLGADIALDPLTYLQVGGRAGVGIGAARLGSKVAHAVEVAMKADDIIPREVITTLSKAGPELKPIEMYARVRNRTLSQVKRNRILQDVDNDRLSFAREQARLVYDKISPRVIQPKMQVPFTQGKHYLPLAPVAVAGKRVLPLSPSLARTAKGENLISKLPGTIAVSTKLGKVFKHGFLEEEFAKPALMAEHVMERLSDKYVRSSYALFKPFGKMSEKDRKEAIFWAESAPEKHLVYNHTLDKKYLAQAPLNDQQKSFIEAVYAHFNEIRAADLRYGLKYSEELKHKFYFPHIYTVEGKPVVESMIPEGAFTKARKGDLTLKELEEVGSEKLKSLGLNVETDIMKIIAMRTRRSAVHQSRNLLFESLGRSAGKISHIADKKKLLKIDQKIAERQAKLDALDLTFPRRFAARKSAATRGVAKVLSQRVSRAEAVRDARLKKNEAEALAHFSMSFQKTLPTMKNLANMSERDFLDSFSHLDKKGMDTLKNLRSTVQEIRRLKAKIAKLQKAKAHGSKVKALEPEVLAALKRAGIDLKTLAPAKRGQTWARNSNVALDGAIQRLEELYKKAAPDAGAGRHRAALKAKERAAQTIHRRHEERVARYVEDAREAQRREFMKLEEAQAKQLRWMNIHTRRIDEWEGKKALATKRNPEIPGNWVELPRLIDGKKYHFPPDLHKAMTRVSRIMDDDEAMGDLAGFMNKTMSYWKMSVTSINPGYRIRNTISDLWNAYIAGVPSAMMVTYGAKAARVQIQASNTARRMYKAHAEGRRYILSTKEKKVLRFMDEAYAQGILSGLFQGDIQVIGHILQSGSMTRAYASKHQPWQIFFRAAGTFNRHGENWARLMHYMYRRDFQKLGVSESANWVRKAHFDYEELSAAEQKYFKAYMPFYTWTRKNIPYQLTQLLVRPGKYAAFPKSVATANELATGAPYTEGPQEGFMPDWMKNSYAFRIPGGAANYMLPGIGVTDIQKLEHPSQFVQLARPDLKMAFELASGRKLLTGEKIRGEVHPRNPVSGAAAAVFKFIPGANVGPTSRFVHGKKVESVGASPYATYFAGQLPWLNYFVSRTSEVQRAKQRDDFGAYAPQLLGLSIFERDLQAEQVSAQLEVKDMVARIMRGLRDEGKIKEPKTRVGSR